MKCITPGSVYSCAAAYLRRYAAGLGRVRKEGVESVFVEGRSPVGGRGLG